MDTTTNEHAVWARSNTGRLAHAFTRRTADGRLQATCRTTITREDTARVHTAETVNARLCKSCETQWNAHLAQVEASMAPATEADDRRYVAPAITARTAAVVSAELKALNVALDSESDTRRADELLDAVRYLDNELSILEDREQDAPADIAGTRIRCSDGRVRTATRLETVNGAEWIHTEDRSAWRADKSELIDTSRISEMRAVADAAAYRVTSASDATDPQRQAALDQLGKAMRYLADADPLYAAAAAQTEERATFTGTLTDVAPGDVIHVEGIRATVLHTGTAEGDAVRGDRPRWWAEIIGATEEDQALTFRRPFHIGRIDTVAATETVTIERPTTTR